MTLLIIILIVVAVGVGVWYISRRRSPQATFGGQAKPKPLPMVQPIQGLKTPSGSERQKPPVSPASPAGRPNPFETPKPPIPPTPPAPPFPPSNPPAQTL